MKTAGYRIETIKLVGHLHRTNNSRQMKRIWEAKIRIEMKRDRIRLA